MAPVGAVGASLTGAVIIQLSDWRWAFLWKSLFGVVVFGAVISVVGADLTYWAMAFPPMFASAFTIDLITASAQNIAGKAVAKRHQGVVGSEINTFRDGTDLLRGYHASAYFAVGLSATALVIFCFIRISRDTREDWGEGVNVSVQP
ncbi:hypothetical protein PG993_000569 [Apiospora rasikravindrae]|uniref:Major facilitator superfamily (MFS) profile domain-containing protein n=1 Tax=Apiospora rasikravindrae TaxID=990691 RepID=A0ABR1U9G0_9PEZI